MQDLENVSRSIRNPAASQLARRCGAVTARKRSLPARCSEPELALVPSAKTSSPVATPVYSSDVSL